MQCVGGLTFYKLNVLLALIDKDLSVQLNCVPDL